MCNTLHLFSFVYISFFLLVVVDLCWCKIIIFVLCKRELRTCLCWNAIHNFYGQYYCFPIVMTGSKSMSRHLDPRIPHPLLPLTIFSLSLVTLLCFQILNSKPSHVIRCRLAVCVFYLGVGVKEVRLTLFRAQTPLAPMHQMPRCQKVLWHLPAKGHVTGFVIAPLLQCMTS